MQRAFRQRKETYIKQLEQEVREYREMEKQSKAVQAENYVLREYIITLQSRCVDAGVDIPPQPPNITLNHAQQGPPPEAQMSTDEPQPASNPTNNMSAGNQLEAVAQAIAGLAAQEQMGDKQPHYPSPQLKHLPVPTLDTRTAEEINRHLEAGGGAPHQQ